MEVNSFYFVNINLEFSFLTAFSSQIVTIFVDLFPN